MPPISHAVRARQRGFTVIEVLITIVVTALAVFGVMGAVLSALHTQSDHDITAMLDDDALAVLSDVRVVTEYDPVMLAELRGKASTMTRTLPSGLSETITVHVVAVAAAAPAPRVPASRAIATAFATAVAGPNAATERITLYQEAPAPGSVVTE